MESLHDHISVKVAADGFEAFVLDDGTHTTVTEEELKELLATSGIVFGVLEDSLKAVARGEINGQPVVVACGVRPVNGADGWVEYCFDHQRAKPMEDAGGKVDLHEMNYIHNVTEGVTLAKIHQAGAGTPGTTVTGQSVSAKPGQKPHIHPGPHTRYVPDELPLIVAEASGNVILRADGTIEVQPLVLINGNVDFATGNIDFVGSLRVMGDIKSDFSVKAQKDIEVLGNVEDAVIEAGGSVRVHKGFIGSGKGSIKAAGTITVQHILNQSVTAEKDIVIEKESVNGNLRAGGRIAVPHGTIAGGTVEATEEIEVNDLGTGEHSHGRLRVGRKGWIIERLAQVEKELLVSGKQLADVKEGVYRLIRMKLDTGALSPDREQMLQKLQEVQKRLPDRVKELEDEKAKLTEDMKQDWKARVVVHGTLFENVLIDINGVRMVADSAVRDVIVVERGGVIEMRTP
jgi:uncharacterized protein